MPQNFGAKRSDLPLPLCHLKNFPHKILSPTPLSPSHIAICEINSALRQLYEQACDFVVRFAPDIDAILESGKPTLHNARHMPNDI